MKFLRCLILIVALAHIPFISGRVIPNFRFGYRRGGQFGGGFNTGLPNIGGFGLPNVGGLGLPNLGGRGLPNLGGLGLPNLGGLGLPNLGGLNLPNLPSLG
ncbi:hypothetical protein QE152_g35205 [Popillia japonica]|uniref:Uncharacterized protein n=1 Tax=Popillia japonica TaxID=7064 RepID=A0AAW1IGK2_POPJA